MNNRCPILSASLNSRLRYLMSSTVVVYVSANWNKVSPATTWCKHCPGAMVAVAVGDGGGVGVFVGVGVRDGWRRRGGAWVFLGVGSVAFGTSVFVGMLKAGVEMLRRLRFVVGVALAFGGR